MTPHKIAIVGAGVVGMSTALWLQRYGFVVEVFDRGGPGEGASLGNAGVVAVSEVTPVGTAETLRSIPSMLFSRHGSLALKASYLPQLMPWLIHFARASRKDEVTRISEALAQLLAGATAAWRELTAEIGISDILRHPGWLKVFRNPESTGLLQAELERLRHLGVKVEVLNRTALADLEPALAPVFDHALYFQEAGLVINPLRLVQQMAARFVDRGGIFRAEMVDRVEPLENGCASVVTSSAERGFETVVVATGAWSQKLISRFDLRVPLDTERGYHVMLPTPKLSLGRSIMVNEPGFVLSPMEHGLRLTSGVEFAGLSAPPDFRKVRALVSEAQKIMPGLSAEVESEWLGFRPSLPDSLPVIGAIPQYPSIILAFGHGHLGLTLGAKTGQIVANLVANKPDGTDITPFRPTRWRN